jgi:flagellar basal-body rod modification protein FlgD
MVDSVAASAGLIQDEQSKTGKSKQKLADDLDSFLTLLTTQLKAQDPLSPMDSTEFTNQLVQFAQVEQQIYQNENLEALLDSTFKTQQAMAINFLDSFIEVETDKVMLEDGQAVFTYGLSDDAQKVSVHVKDSSGTIVRTFGGDPSAGLHKLTWDGTDADGNPVEDGLYRLEVNATQLDDADNDETLETWTTSLGKVTGVASDDTGTFLAIGDLSVDMNKILGVFNTLPLDDVDSGDDITGGGATDEGDGDETAEDETATT